MLRSIKLIHNSILKYFLFSTEFIFAQSAPLLWSSRVHAAPCYCSLPHKYALPDLTTNCRLYLHHFSTPANLLCSAPLAHYRRLHHFSNPANLLHHLLITADCTTSLPQQTFWSTCLFLPNAPFRYPSTPSAPLAHYCRLHRSQPQQTFCNTCQFLPTHHFSAQHTFCTTCLSLQCSKGRTLHR
jgi:hypothetical protein